MNSFCRIDIIQIGCPASRTGGDDGIRTHDPLLAGQVLSQLSYTPINNGCSFSPFFESKIKEEF